MLEEPREDREPESEMAYSPPVADGADDDACDSDSDDADGLFSRVPDEVCEVIFRHLDTASFFRLSYTCSRFFKVCTHATRLTTRGQSITAFPVLHSGRSRQQLSHNQRMIDAVTFPKFGEPRRALVGELLRQHNLYLRMKREEEQRRQEKQEEKLKKREERVLLLSGFSVVYELITALVMLLQVVLIALKLDDRITGPWGAVLIPLWVMTFFFVLKPAVLQFLELFGTIDPGDRLEVERQDTSAILSYLPKHGITDDIENGHNKIFYWPLVAFVLAGIVLLGVKVVFAPAGLPWIAGFSMFAIAGIVGLLADLVWDEPIWANENYLDRVPPLLPLLGFVASCIVLGRRLDGAISLAASWHCVLAPMYIALIAMPVVSLAVGISTDFTFDSHVDSDVFWYIFAFISLLFITAPGVTFLGLLGSVLDGTIDLTFVQVFIPVFVQFSLLPIACVAWNLIRAYLLGLS